MTKRYAKFLTALFCAFIGGVFLLSVILPKQDFSPLENRYLQSQLRFPITTQSAATNEQTDYGLTSRMRQNPGRKLTLGQSDNRGEVKV